MTSGDTSSAPSGFSPIADAWSFLSTGGEMGGLMRAKDWSASPLGSPDRWPQSLRSIVSLMLNSRFPMFLAWGRDLSFLYNDAYVDILSAKHPSALGARFEDIWAEIWDDISPMIDAALAGRPTFMENLPLTMNRRGYDEPTWFTFSYSPVTDDDDAVAGMFCACTETTPQMLAARAEAFRMSLDEALRPLADPGAIMQAAAETLGLYLEVDRAGYAEIEDDGVMFVVARDWSVEGMSSFVGRHRLDDFGPELISELKAGRSVALEDVLSDPLTAGEEVVEAFETITMRAAITVPLVKDDRFAAALYAHARSPRRWTAEEETLVRDVAERTWAAVERVRAEQDLRESERELQRLADNLPLLVSFVDRSERYGFNNRGYQEWFGRAPGELKGRAVRDVIGPEAYALLQPQIARALQGERFTIERVVPYRDGGLRDVEVDFVPRFADDGTTDGYYAIVQDIAERKRAEEAILRNESRLRFLDRLGVETGKLADADAVLKATTRMLGEHLGLSVCAYADMDEDQDGFTIRGDWAAPGSVSIVGHYSLAAFGRLAVANLGAGLPLVVGDNLAELAPEEAATFQALGIAATICMPLVKEGRLTALMAIHQNIPRAWTDDDLSLLREVTERSWAHVERVGAVAELRASEAKLRAMNGLLEQRVHERTLALQQSEKSIRTVFETSHQHQGLLTPEGSILYVNRTALDSIDRRLEDLVGKDFWDSPWFNRTPGMPEAIRDAVKRVAAGEVWTMSMVLTMPDGERVYDVSMRPVFDDGGSVAAIVPEAVETTARVRAEEALRQSQKMEAVGQLTGGLAHDFNNLLAGISGSLEMIQTRIAQGRVAEVDRYLLAAQGAAKRAAALTHRLLAFSRRQTLEPKPTDVNRLVAGLEELVRRTVGPSVEIDTVAQGGLWPVLVDPNQLENALLNLCINARDAMPDGGRIIVETANRWLDDRAARERGLDSGQYVSLCVSDNGTGMSAEVIERAFDPFFTTKPIGMGTGLGLSMIYGFVRQSGGQVRIYSEVGEGSMVCVYLPRHHAGEARAEDSAPAIAAVPARAGETVLVIDDEPLVRMLIVDLLEELGYTVIEAGDGPSGLKVIRSDVRLDLLVTDVGLPNGMNGRQVADAAREVRPDLKVLFVTGYAENAVLGHGHLDAGMQVVTKPFDMDVLTGRIRRLIAGT